MKIPHNKVFFVVMCLGLIMGTSSLKALAEGKWSTSTGVGSGNQGSTPATTQEKVNLNAATEKQLEELPGIGPASAKKIIAGRPYSSVADLSKSGIPAKTIEKISPLVTVGAGAAGKNQDTGSNPTTSTPSSTGGAPSAPRTAPPATNAAGEQAPNAKGTVWVNLDSGVYHYPNSRYYGKTKNGKYMPEADAISAGYHAAKNEHPPQ
jgi:Helix-hairpin-helix motif